MNAINKLAKNLAPRLFNGTISYRLNIIIYDYVIFRQVIFLKLMNLALDSFRALSARAMFFLAVASIVSACAPKVDPQASGSFSAAVAIGNYSVAASTAQRLARTSGGQPELLWTLNAGAAALHAGERQAAINHLDVAEELMRASDEATFNWGRTYRFGTYDAIMVNIYKALAYLGENDAAAARVELNRMEDRQRRTRERFERQIAELSAQNESKLASNASLRDALAAAQGSPEVREDQALLAQYRNAQPFQNPAGFYLRGVYLLNSDSSNDAEAARQAFETVAAMMNRPRVVMNDKEAADRLASGRRPAPHVWVFFENGQSPTFIQRNFTVPMPVLARGGGVTVRPVTVSMPVIVRNQPAFASLNVAAGNTRANTEIVANIEAVMVAEYATRYNSLLAAAVFEAVAKAVGISAANAVGSRLGGVAGLALDIAATAAANVTESDTRSWQILPRDIQATRLPIPSDGRVTLRAPNGEQQVVTLPNRRSALILVKAQTPASPMTVQVLPL